MGLPRISVKAARASVGGVLMGLANLVPGISGGTMLLATGVYTDFVQAVAGITTFRFRLRYLALLLTIGVAALLSILLLAGPVKLLVTEQRWVMYSLFVGLTLGGVPLVLRMARPLAPAVGWGTAVGFSLMAAMALTRASGGDGGGALILAVAGIAGACAMILPGVSGAYMLLVLGQYETILGAVDQCKRGLGGDFDLLLDALDVVLPVGIGVALGVAGISNLVRWALRRHEKATLGFLLGLLLGAVLGIWPFQETAGEGGPGALYAPTLPEALGALGLAAAGFAFTTLVDRLGAAGRPTGDPSPSGRPAPGA